MKTYILLTAILLSTIQLRALEPAAETAFIQKVQSAIDRKDGEAMFSLVYLNGVEPGMKEMLSKQISDIVNKPVKSISLVDPSPDQIFEYTREGITYRTNLTPVKMLKIEYTETTPVSPGSISNASMSLPVGNRDGSLLITTSAPVTK
jgi:hypothetical protein